nr:putative glycerol-3-phosphate transporter 3 [Ipomoea batatas]
MELKPGTLTLLLVNLAGIMERADESLLPGVYKEVGEALHADPTRLGSLTLFRSIVQSLCYPLAAYLSVHHNRAHVIAYGAFLWAAATFLVAFSSSFFQELIELTSRVMFLFLDKVAVSRALNGIGLAIVAPAIQSLVADSTDDSNRGMAFGWLQFTSNIGSIVGGLLALLIAPITFMGIPGWRVSFHLVGIISVVVGILVRLFANDPHFPDGSLRGNNSHGEAPGKSFWSEATDLVHEAKTVMKIPSFQIIVAQGVTGSFPWSALSFTPMWLELTGFSHLQTAILTGTFVVGCSIGGLFGGRAGDLLSQRLPNHGRIILILSQISSASAIPLAAILLLALPNDPSSNVYGYRPVPRDAQSIATDRKNATSLAKALFTAIGTPMLLCCFIYSFLYCTYPRDRDLARMKALIRSEMQLLNMGNSALRGQYSQVLPCEVKERRLDAELNYGKDGPDLDDSDEKVLITRLASNNTQSYRLIQEYRTSYH